MSGETLYFSSIESLSEFFREGRPFFNEMYVKKMATMSLFYNRVPTQSWPLNSTTEQTGFRFGRGWYDENQPWKKISSACGGDSCSNEFETVKMAGTDSYSWDLLRREMISEWFCVENLLYKLFPMEQVLQIEETNAMISKHVHEEFMRANFLGAAGNHWLPIANDNGAAYCGQVEHDGWYVEQHAGVNESGFNLQYIRVKSRPADLDNIAFLGLDVLDDILLNLQNEDDAYRLDLTEAAGMPLLDLIVPDAKTARKMYFQAKNSSGFWDSNSGFTPELRDLALGIRRVIGDYAFSYDIDAPKFNVDTTFNNTLPAYSANNPATWPRLVRVSRYVRVAAEEGCKYIPNTDYNNADFAITVPWIEKAITKWMMPAAAGYGSVTMPTQDYAGAWDFFNPKSTENPFQKNGRFQAQHRIGAQISDPTLMHPILHRLDNSRTFQGGSCPLNQYYAPSVAPDCYVCTGVSEQA